MLPHRIGDLESRKLRGLYRHLLPHRIGDLETIFFIQYPYTLSYAEETVEINLVN